MSNVDAVVFDLGNVLIAVDEPRGAAQIAARTDKSPADVSAYFRSTPHAIELSLGKITKRQFYRTVAQDLGFRGEYDDFARAWADIFTPIEPMIALAQELATRRPRLLLSNTNIIHIEWVTERYPWLGEFDALIYSHEVGLLKPDAAIYQLAVQRAGLPAERLLFIDDLAINVEAARHAGSQAWQHGDPAATRAQLTKLGVLTI
jgi:putative hydrolase of the HAD superfamily